MDDVPLYVGVPHFAQEPGNDLQPLWGYNPKCKVNPRMTCQEWALCAPLCAVAKCVG